MNGCQIAVTEHVFDRKLLVVVCLMAPVTEPFIARAGRALDAIVRTSDESVRRY